jgi:hypothetical protein
MIYNGDFTKLLVHAFALQLKPVQLNQLTWSPFGAQPALP